jgi:hypothetical protein
VEKRRHFDHFHIAGFIYWDRFVVFRKLKTGTEQRLELEAESKTVEYTSEGSNSSSEVNSSSNEASYSSSEVNYFSSEVSFSSSEVSYCSNEVSSGSSELKISKYFN